jgi:glutamine phosphoribosylpyrophosphate amidotransferase
MAFGVKCERHYTFNNVIVSTVCHSLGNFRQPVGDYDYTFLHCRKLLLAKDHQGIRPLIYYQDEESFISPVHTFDQDLRLIGIQ